LPRGSIRKELVSHLMEYEYFIDKASSFIVALTVLVLIIIIPNWPATLSGYSTNPSPESLHEIGVSTLITALVLMAATIAYLIPHFEPTLRPHGFKTLRDKRMLNLYLAIIVGLLAVITITYIVYGLTMTIS
jgi:uncharacterized membrane protein